MKSKPGIEHGSYGKKKKYNPFVRFIVLPLTIFSLIMVSIGIFTFISANNIMRQPPKQLEAFANNILPAFSVAYFTSLDGSTNLNGWFFPSRGTPKSTVIMVHSNGNNRLEYDSDTVDLYDYFVNNSFNVLSFDLRHSGSSSGNLSTFGYSEWEDVLAAISYTTAVSSADNVILYGFQSGVTACLIAAEKLMLAASDPGLVADNISSLSFRHEIIRGFILDMPLASSDDYIRHHAVENIFAGEKLIQYTIPFAVRLSAGSEPVHSLTAILAKVQSPVHIISKIFDNEFLDERSVLITKERIRLFPNSTSTYIIEEDISTYPFMFDKEKYISSINDFLKRFF